MATKKVEVEITNKGVIPQSIQEDNYVPVVADVGDIVEVYEDVADKLILYKRAVSMDTPGAGSINETEEANAKEERDRKENLLTGEKEEEKKPSKKKDDK